MRCAKNPIVRDTSPSLLSLVTRPQRFVPLPEKKGKIQSAVPAAAMSPMVPSHRHKPLHPHIRQALNLWPWLARHLITHPRNLLKDTLRMCHRKHLSKTLLSLRNLFPQLKDIRKLPLILVPHSIEPSLLRIRCPPCLQIQLVMSRAIVRLLAITIANIQHQLSKAQSPNPPPLGLSRHLFSKKRIQREETERRNGAGTG